MQLLNAGTEDAEQQQSKCVLTHLCIFLARLCDMQACTRVRKPLCVQYLIVPDSLSALMVMGLYILIESNMHMHLQIAAVVCENSCVSGC